MINASVEFRQHIEKGKPLYSRADLQLANGTVLALEPTDFVFNSGFTIESATSSQNSFDIGSAIPKKLTMKLNNYDGKFNSYSFNGAIVTNTEVFANLDSGTRESIKKGQFKVDKQEFRGSTLTLTCYDALSELDVIYDGKFGKITLQEFAQYVADLIGVELKNEYFVGYIYEIDIPNNNYTVRQLFNWVLEYSGNFAIINTDNQLEIKWYDTKLLDYADDIINANTFLLPSSDVYDAGAFSEMSDSQLVIDAGTFNSISNRIVVDTIFSHNVDVDNVTITGVRTRDISGNLFNYGNRDYMLHVENIFFNNSVETLSRIADTVIGMTFRPMSISALNNPLIEAGDVGTVIVDNVPYATVFTNVTYGIGKHTRLVCGAKTKEEVQAIVNDKNQDVWKKGEDIQVGGVDNKLGKIEIHDANGDKMGYWDNTGIHLQPENFSCQAVSVEWGTDTGTSKGIRKAEISSDSIKVSHTYTPISDEIIESITLKESGIYFSHPDGDISLTRTQLIQLLSLIQ